MKAKDFLQQLNQMKGSTSIEAIEAVLQIIQKVRREGDQAVRTYTKEFDGVELEDFKVDPSLLKASYERLDPQLKEALHLARDRIVAYESQIKYQDQDLGDIRYSYHPLERVGLYIPGGTALYPSSVLMTAVAAQVAGVKEFYAVTPVFEPHNVTFATLYFLGIDQVYTIGGAQAVAALAYGTETIPKVDKIVGPGNAYVALAKRLVYGDVGIDMIAGPSEILVYADQTAKPRELMYDLFAQAEHDPNARTYFLTEDPALAQEVQALIQEEIDQQVRADIIRASIANNHYCIVDERQALIEVINEVAAEHVSIQHEEAEAIIEQIRYAGAVFQGRFTPEAIGDYVAGPSHVLPTDRTARFSHGLNVNDYLTSHAVINLSAQTFQEIAPAAEVMAQSEGLDCHYQSLAIRSKEAAND